jgi:16S rRNA (guanine527-N7)-methyltransferase
MTEEEAQDWLDRRGWWEGEVGDRLRRFVALVLDEADRQNLISASSREHIWARHIVDSAQLLALLPPDAAGEGLWADLGTGAGFPGMVVACLRPAPTRLIELRPLRAAFLERASAELGLAHVKVNAVKVEKVELSAPARIISARAYAPLDKLLGHAHHLSDEETVWLLPKGRNGEKELAIARRDWQAVFHVEQSFTDPDSVIVTAQALRRRVDQAPVRKPQNLRKNWRKT